VTNDTGGQTPTSVEEPTATAVVDEASPTSEEQTNETPESTVSNPPPAASGKNYGSFVPEPAGSEGGSVVFGWYNDIVNFNPLVFENQPGLIHPVFEGMITRDPSSSEPLPLLATAWETSDDALTWIFTLREGVTFHDGEPFTADDVAYTYQAIIDEASLSLERQYYVERIEAIAATDDMTVEIVALQPSADFINVATLVIVPQHVYGEIPIAEMREHPISTGEDFSLIIGTGPFRFFEHVVGDHWTYVKYDDYWAGPAHLDEVIFRPQQDTSLIGSLLLDGFYDASFISPTDIPLLEGSDVRVVSGPPTALDYFPFNLNPERSPITTDVRVRQALAYGLDRQAFVDVVYEGTGEVADTIIPPVLWSCDVEGVTALYPFDPDRANQLLDEAGWVMGDDGIREKDGERLALVQLNFATTISELGFALAQENWRQIGVELTSEFIPTGTTLFDRYTSGDFEVSFWGTLEYVGSGYDELAYVGLCDSYPNAGNQMMYCNPEFDALMEEVSKEFDQAKRIELFTQIQNIYLTDLPMIPIIFKKLIYGVNNRLHNVVSGPQLTTYNIETWWVES
jgi:peptide/nickel transport system substrate-binding protein